MHAAGQALSWVCLPWTQVLPDACNAIVPTQWPAICSSLRAFKHHGVKPSGMWPSCWAGTACHLADLGTPDPIWLNQGFDQYLPFWHPDIWGEADPRLCQLPSA